MINDIRGGKKNLSLHSDKVNAIYKVIKSSGFKSVIIISDKFDIWKVNNYYTQNFIFINDLNIIDNNKLNELFLEHKDKAIIFICTINDLKTKACSGLFNKLYDMLVIDKDVNTEQTDNMNIKYNVRISIK